MSRFERKILFAIGLSVFLTLGGSVFLAQGALREVYRVGVNERFGAELVHGVEARRAQLMTLRQSSEQAADAVKWAVEAELATGERVVASNDPADVSPSPSGSLYKATSTPGIPSSGSAKSVPDPGVTLVEPTMPTAAPSTSRRWLSRHCSPLTTSGNG